MFCPHCGRQLSEGANFCGGCGASVRTVGQAAQPALARVTAPVPSVQPIQQTPQWQPATTPELGGQPRMIQTNRGLLKYVVFSILTLGIYGFYFVYKMAQDMNTMCDDDDQKTGGLLAFIVLSFFTFGIYGIYWWYKIANRVYTNAPRYGITVAEQGSTFLLWYLIGIILVIPCCFIPCLIAYHTVMKNVNSLAVAYNRQHGFM